MEDFVLYCRSVFDGILSRFFSEVGEIFVKDYSQSMEENLRRLCNFKKTFEDAYKDSRKDSKEFLKKAYQEKSGFSQQLPSNYKELLGACFSDFEKRLQQSKDQINVAINRSKLEICKSQYTRFDNVPIVPISSGGIHPIEATIRDCVSYFEKYGFIRVEGPEIEDEYHNFDALGLTSEHPARDSQDSFYLDEKRFLLRTQTSPVQIRIMETCQPPIAVVSAGRVFRRDATDASHLPYFFQMEGLLVDLSVTFVQLKVIIQDFLQQIFGEHLPVRFRPDYFPFTEPSCEVSVRCPFCYQGNVPECSPCKKSGWVEILGAGMVHPDILRRVGIDPNEYSGFAFGCGIERIAMIRESIRDIRHLYENDLDFLSVGSL